MIINITFLEIRGLSYYFYQGGNIELAVFISIVSYRGDRLARQSPRVKHSHNSPSSMVFGG